VAGIAAFWISTDSCFNGLAITSVFRPDPHTHVEIVKYPDKSNAMKMVWKKTFFGGKIKIDNSEQKKVPAYIPIGQEVMERYAKKVNSIPQNILLEVFFNRPTTAHIPGGCPMSDSPETRMVDKNLKVHGYPDFYITDGSVIQGNIGVNPSLTITAMAEYVMNNIPAKNGYPVTEISEQLKMLEEEWKKKTYK